MGWLAGIGALAIPGLGPFIAAGPILGLLAGVGAGAVTGILMGALTGLGMLEYEAKRYEGRIRSGGASAIGSTREAAADFSKSDKPRPQSAAV